MRVLSGVKGVRVDLTHREDGQAGQPFMNGNICSQRASIPPVGLRMFRLDQGHTEGTESLLVMANKKIWKAKLNSYFIK